MFHYWIETYKDTPFFGIDQKIFQGKDHLDLYYNTTNEGGTRRKYGRYRKIEYALNEMVP